LTCESILAYTLSGKTGSPHIVYSSSDGLQYARWDKTTNTWHISTVDTDGSSSSLALDATGNSYVAYIYSPCFEFDLRYAAWDTSAGTWRIQTLDNGQCKAPSLTLDSAGNPHISYEDWNNSDLKYT